jgi:hypothetical protein
MLGTMLEQIEEALDQIAFTIECEVALPLDVSVGLGRNDRNPKIASRQCGRIAKIAKPTGSKL